MAVCSLKSTQTRPNACCCYYRCYCCWQLLVVFTAAAFVQTAMLMVNGRRLSPDACRLLVAWAACVLRLRAAGSADRSCSVAINVHVSERNTSNHLLHTHTHTDQCIQEDKYCCGKSYVGCGFPKGGSQKGWMWLHFWFTRIVLGTHCCWLLCCTLINT